MPWDIRRLLPGHGWSTRNGCKTIVLDRGAVQFDYPRSWMVEPGAVTVALLDRKPPKGNRLEVCCFRLPPRDWSRLPVADLVDDVTSKPRKYAVYGPLREEIRRGIEIAWRDSTFMPSQAWLAHHARCFRVCVARLGNVHCLLTYEFACLHRARCNDAWDTVLETLQLDRVIADPREGPGLACS
ncbi:MAG TPA: hypothetical protein VML75_17005 [Kofleriaceae bacterium]|nr:hypothetical protein [Kofleriaceae bacterium]